MPQSTNRLHHAGDGCAGESRPRSPQEAVEVARLADLMVMMTARADHASLILQGDYLALHYGPEGEWAATVALARHITRGSGGSRVGHSVPVDDPQRRQLILELANRRCAATTPLLVTMATINVESPLQGMVQAIATGKTAEARRAWEAIYYSPKPFDPLTPMAATATMLVWSARHTAAQTPAPPQHSRSRAHLN